MSSSAAFLSPSSLYPLGTHRFERCTGSFCDEFKRGGSHLGSSYPVYTSKTKRTRQSIFDVFCSATNPVNTTSKVHHDTDFRLNRNSGRELELCVLVGVEITTKSKSGGRLFGIQDSMQELERLAETAGMKVVSVITQALTAPYPGTYIGTGKVREVRSEMEAVGCKTCIFDDELSPAQQRTLENEFGGEERGIKVLDRTALILDIFAQHAATREGQLQVELALYQYRLPRLTRMWTHLERQSGSGGVGLRGPGETQLESDRRMINVRIDKLRRDINLVRMHRSRQRAARRDNAGLPVVALIGYTNAGKSTVLNALTGADVLVANALFATLDPTTRRAKFEGLKLSPEVLLTDTVGFVQNLPTQLVAAFRATLEEVVEADVLVHVVDASQPWTLMLSQITAVDNVLEKIGADGKPTIIALNKIDILLSQTNTVDNATDSSDQESFDNIATVPDHREVDHGWQDIGEEERIPRVEMLVDKIQKHTNCECVAVSARTGYGIDDVGILVEDVLRDIMVPVEAVVPYSRGDLVSAMHEQGSCEFEEYSSNGTRIVGRAPHALASRLREYVVANEDGNHLRGANDNDENETDWTDLARGRH